MLRPVSHSQPTSSPSLEVSAPLPCVSFSSVGTWKEEPPTFFTWLFGPLISCFRAALYRIAPSPDELRRLETVFDQIARGVLSFLRDRERAEKVLRLQLKEVEELYQTMSSKWFPNLQGMRFLRVNLLKIKLRLLVLLGEETAVCKASIASLGYILPKTFDIQLEKLGMVHRSPYRQLITICNGPAKVLRKVRGRRDSNSQLPP